ncbi:MAG: type II secretion system F family protein [Pseudomonadota bacterium]
MLGGISLEAITDGPFVAYVLFFAVGFLLVQGAFGLFGQAQMNKQLNRRLKARENAGSVQQLIIELRRERALNDAGEMSLSSRWFNQLVTRSGVKFEPVKWALMAGIAALSVGGFVGAYSGNWVAALLLTAGIFAGGPVFILSNIGKKRSARLASQLPDALSIIVRSLEAGHPVPTAIGLVGREMPDPIGTEFGMLADEVAYGSSLNDAVRRLAMRSFNADVDLFSATIRLQQKTGGNLSELLKLNGSAIRDRQTLRLKIKAASAEGRMSALILTAAPFIVGIGIHLMNQDFYGSVIHKPVVQYWLMGFGVWMLIGNLIMRKMIAFKI